MSIGVEALNHISGMIFFVILTQQHMGWSIQGHRPMLRPRMDIRHTHQRKSTEARHLSIPMVTNGTPTSLRRRLLLDLGHTLRKPINILK